MRPVSQVGEIRLSSERSPFTLRYSYPETPTLSPNHTPLAYKYEVRLSAEH